MHAHQPEALRVQSRVEPAAVVPHDDRHDVSSLDDFDHDALRRRMLDHIAERLLHQAVDVALDFQLEPSRDPAFSKGEIQMGIDLQAGCGSYTCEERFQGGSDPQVIEGPRGRSRPPAVRSRWRVSKQAR